MTSVAEIIPEGFAQLEMRMVHVLQPRAAFVTWAQAYSSVPTVGSVNALWNAIFPVIDQEIDSSITFGPIKAIVGTATDEHLVVNGTSFGTGTVSTSTNLNIGQALLVRKLTARGGRRGRGRFYWPNMLEDAEVDEVGRLTSTAVANKQGIMDAFLTTIAGVSGWDEMYLLHSPSGEDVENPSTPGSPNQVLALQVDPVVGSQRRRLGR
jgi:hypothetical protein